MSYLALALHCEGPTDRRFLEPLIRRALVRLVGIHCTTSVDVAEQFVDLAATSRETEHVAQRIVDAALAVDLVFVHADGGNDPDRVRMERFNPIIEEIGQAAAGQRLAFVAVVPVRETEAWLLADPDGIRRAFGTTRSINELGLPPNARNIENVPDPKALLAEAYRRSIGQTRRRRRASQGYQAFFTLLGEQVEFARLEEVPAFRRFKGDLDALRVRYLSGIRES